MSFMVFIGIKLNDIFFFYQGNAKMTTVDLTSLTIVGISTGTPIRKGDLMIEVRALTCFGWLFQRGGLGLSIAFLLPGVGLVRSSVVSY